MQAAPGDAVEVRLRTVQEGQLQRVAVLCPLRCILREQHSFRLEGRRRGHKGACGVLESFHLAGDEACTDLGVRCIPFVAQDPARSDRHGLGPALLRADAAPDFGIEVLELVHHRLPDQLTR